MSVIFKVVLEGTTHNETTLRAVLSKAIARIKVIAKDLSVEIHAEETLKPIDIRIEGV